MTHDQVCAIKAVQSAVALARKVGVTDAEILEAIAVSVKREEKPQQKVAPEVRP
jgi:hypothetical protein